MNRVFNCIFLVILTVFLSCKNDTTSTQSNKKDTLDNSKNSVPKNLETFSLKLKAVYPKDDIVILFYTQFEGETYSEEQMIRKEIKGSEAIQEIELKMSPKDYPLNLRIDFSGYETQEVIKVYECVLNYQNDSYTIEGKHLKDYFIFNDGIEMLQDSLSFRLKHFKLNNKPVFDPYIKGNSRLEETLITKI